MHIIDCDMCPLAAKFVELRAIALKHPTDFRAAVRSANAKVDLWNYLGLKFSHNDEYKFDAKDNCLIISQYEKK